MKNIHNVVWDALRAVDANRRIRDRVEVDPNNSQRYIVTLQHQGKEMLVEVIVDAEGVDYAGVLERVGFSRRFEEVFMNTFMDMMD